MSTAAVFLDIKKIFDTTRHLGFLYKLSTLQLSISLTKLIGSFFSQRNFRVSVEGKMSTPRDIHARVPQGSVLLSPTLYSRYTYKWYAPNTWCLSRSLCWRHLYICARPQRGFFLRKLQRGLSAIDTWGERWNIQINEHQIHAIYFSHRFRLPEAHLTLNEQNIPSVNHVKYLGVIFDKRITRRLHTEMTEAKAFRTFIRIYSQLKSEQSVCVMQHRALWERAGGK
jgi:hypothetical protein